MLRVLAFGLALAALLVVAAMVPFAHVAGDAAPPPAPRVKRPPWPAWAHGAAQAAASNPQRSADRALGAPPDHERPPSPDGARLSAAAGLAGTLNRRQEPCVRSIAPLRGWSAPVPAPPPRSA